MRKNRVSASVLIAVALHLSPALGQQQRQPPSLPTQTAVTISIPLVGVPSSLAGSGSWTSQCIQMSYYRAYTLFVGLAAAGTIQSQRYADAACTLPIDAVPSSAQALTMGASCPSAGYCGAFSSNDGHPFVALKVTLTDTSTSTNAIVSTAFLPGAE